MVTVGRMSTPKSRGGKPLTRKLDPRSLLKIKKTGEVTNPPACLGVGLGRDGVEKGRKRKKKGYLGEVPR